MNVMLQLIL